MESFAGLQMFRIHAANNAAIGGGDGGFLFARFANSVLLSDVRIERCATNSEGGGGGLAVYSTKIGLERVTLNECEAGQRGGGGMLLDEGSEAHLLDCKMSNNVVSVVGSGGGHIRVAASTMILHNKDVGLIWPKSVPVFEDEVTISSIRGNTMINGKAVRSGGGAIACMASLSKKVVTR